MGKQNKIIVIDFGGQYNQLVARRVRECGVYCEIVSYRKYKEKLAEGAPKGIILTGGPNSCYEDNAPACEVSLFQQGIPVLGLCYGAQLMQHLLGGTVKTAEVSEYGRTEVRLAADHDGAAVRAEAVRNGESAHAEAGQNGDLDHASAGQSDNEVMSTIHSELFRNVPDSFIAWMSHTDYIAQPAPGFRITVSTKDCPCAACEDPDRGLYAIQFHPEVKHTEFGSRIIENFVLGICGCDADWQMEGFAERTIREIREKVGERKALCALSGGVDSSVAAVMMSRAIGKNLTCVFVDHGLLRKNEGDEVEAVFGPAGNYELNFIRVNAQERFYKALAGVTEPEKKRRIIGEEFIRVFEEEAKKIGAVDFLVQGTIYPDVVESGLGGESAVIKSHHNVGGLPEHVDFKEIIEPLRDLFKDEVRKVGLALGIPEHLVFRQPFPGPGLGVRILGEITEEKVRLVQDADAIFREEVAKAAGLPRSGAGTVSASGSGAAMETGSGAEDPKKGGSKTGTGNDSGAASAAGRSSSSAAAPDWLPDQYFAALTDMRSVGVMGDFRTYGRSIVLRAVSTSDFMTAECSQIPFEVLQTTMTRITNEVKGIGRVLFDLTGKPPGTIELE